MRAVREAVAALGGPRAAPLAGWIYAVLAPLQGLHHGWMGRRGRVRFAAVPEA